MDSRHQAVTEHIVTLCAADLAAFCNLLKGSTAFRAAHRITAPGRRTDEAAEQIVEIKVHIIKVKKALVAFCPCTFRAKVIFRQLAVDDGFNVGRCRILSAVLTHHKSSRPFKMAFIYLVRATCF